MATKHSAVDPKPGQPVANSGPAAEATNTCKHGLPKAGGFRCHPSSAQSWPGRGAGSPASGGEAAAVPPAEELVPLLEFFALLDRWDREERAQ